MEFTNTPEGITPAHWDMHSKYADVYGGEGDYLYTKEQELNDIKEFAVHPSKPLQPKAGLVDCS